MSTGLKSGLNFGYNHNKSLAVSWQQKNFDVGYTAVGKCPVWNFTAGDGSFVGSKNMPAAASVILYKGTTGATPSQFTLFWGAGAHHPHHSGYQSTQGLAVISVDWQTPKIQLVDGIPSANFFDNSGRLPWAPVISSKYAQLKKLLQSNIDNSDANTLALIKQKTANYTISVINQPGLPGGSMDFDAFLVKANGNTYLRLMIVNNGIGFNSDFAQSITKFGLLPGNQKGQTLFNNVGREHHAIAWNDALSSQLDGHPDSSYVVDKWAPTEEQQVDKTYTKTTENGWSIGGSLDGEASLDGGGGGGGGGGGAGEAGEAAEDAVLLA